MDNDVPEAPFLQWDCVIRFSTDEDEYDEDIGKSGRFA